MAITFYIYGLFALIFAVSAYFEGKNSHLPFLNRVAGFGLSLVWPVPLLVVLITVIREKRKNASMANWVFREKPVRSATQTRIRIPR